MLVTNTLAYFDRRCIIDIPKIRLRQKLKNCPTFFITFCYCLFPGTGSDKIITLKLKVMSGLFYHCANTLGLTIVNNLSRVICIMFL
jgi:hypothetical protein